MAKSARRLWRAGALVLITLPWWLVLRAAVSNSPQTWPDIVWGFTCTIMLVSMSEAVHSNPPRRPVDEKSNAPMVVAYFKGRLWVLGLGGTGLLLTWAVLFGFTHHALVPQPLVIWAILSLTAIVVKGLQKLGAA